MFARANGARMVWSSHRSIWAVRQGQQNRRGRGRKQSKEPKSASAQLRIQRTGRENSRHAGAYRREIHLSRARCAVVGRSGAGRELSAARGALQPHHHGLSGADAAAGRGLQRQRPARLRGPRGREGGDEFGEDDARRHARRRRFPAAAASKPPAAHQPPATAPARRLRQQSPRAALPARSRALPRTATATRIASATTIASAATRPGFESRPQQPRSGARRARRGGRGTTAPASRSAAAAPARALPAAAAAATHEQPEFLRRPVRRARNEEETPDAQRQRTSPRATKAIAGELGRGSRIAASLKRRSRDAHDQALSSPPVTTRA